MAVAGSKRFDELPRAVHKLIRGVVPYQNAACALAAQSKTRSAVGSKQVLWERGGRQTPIIIISDKNGEIARLVQQHACGIVIAPGVIDALVDALRLLSDAPETVSEMGKRARTMLDAHFTQQKALDRWSE
jgi:glycosyltransferase involved in cell wall biosynthesis